ncbi:MULTISPECIES: acyl-CoA thioesterase [unclassified Acinetobacter]|uniref:acyl-CoA thioesterase n=1 Tax=unclassified Acinetobacter TaxID=196816 RepID=UPI0035B76606
MYPFIRFGQTLIKSAWATRKGQMLKPWDVSEIQINSNLSDMDNFGEMNNGRVFTLFDLGRIDFAVRSGLGKLLIKNRWGLVVAGSSIRYRKRIFSGSQVTIKTRIVGLDERWIYLEQSMWVKGEATSSALLRTAVTGKGKALPTQTVLDAIGHSSWTKTPEDWVQAWIDAEQLRPFPPKFDE